MSMSIGGGGDDEPMMDINTTPLIDVMLVLLIMFIITIPVMTHAVKLDMPRASNVPSTAEPEVINLEVDFDGTCLWNGAPVESVGARRLFPQGSRRANRSRNCTSAPSKRAKYDIVARVLALGATQWHAQDRLRRQRAIHVMARPRD